MAEIIAKENEQKQLKYYTDVANKNIEENEQWHEFTKLSISEIAINISKTFNAVLEEVLALKPAKTYLGMLHEIIIIIVKEDRLIYLGILLFFFSLCFIFI
jgi:hypothetical protein